MHSESERGRAAARYVSVRAWGAILAGVMTTGGTKACQYVLNLYGLPQNTTLAGLGHIIGLVGFLCGATLLMFSRLTWHAAVSGILAGWRIPRPDDVRHTRARYIGAGAALLGETLALVAIVSGFRRIGARVVMGEAQWIVSTLSWAAYLMGMFCAIVAVGLIFIGLGTRPIRRPQ